MDESLCRLGMITPSSNTVLEPVTADLALRAGDASVHFTRTRVRKIALDRESGEQFSEAALSAAAGLLSDAKVDVVAWNGTSGSWLGTAFDDEVCRVIESVAGVPATTSTRAILAALSTYKLTRLGLLTPYTTDVGDAVARTYAHAGHRVHASTHLGLSTNFDFAEVTAGQLSDAFERLMSAGCDSVAVVCTNVRAADLVEGWEGSSDALVVDSVCATFWHAMQIAGRAVSVPGAGRLLNPGLPASRTRKP